MSYNKQYGKQKSRQRTRRFAIMITIMLVVSLTMLNMWRAQEVSDAERAAAKAEQRTQDAGGYGTGQAAIGGDFEGVSHHGAPFKFSETNGKLRLIFFGFTHCPDICPTSLATLSAVQDTLGDDAVNVAPVFVTIDPGRDTPDVIKGYISSFHPSTIGVTGSQKQIDSAASAFKVFHSKGRVNDDGGYMVDHSGYIYLMDKEGKYLAHFSYDAAPEKILAALKPHL